ncbi:hypothetical protein M422DRAFT_255472 [Sphaerobolus stellatus SS14]|uniref:Lactate/malate dehydrogenase C-terminal domain-containing protein n=1 Tax=Sphaerobolus stellatus (strain SS14) TaxID=990650 RepID=A0A0C9V3R8_SPHS4|nr:hypothetical protein M422DRAFT_255472 [Sphaerobolus stellatus SS14]
MGEEPVSMLSPLESHHYQYDDWKTLSHPEHAKWEARTHMTRGIRLKFDLSYWPDSTGSFRIWCVQSLTRSKKFELLHASMAQLCHIKGILEESFLGKCDSYNLQSLLLELYLFISDPVISQGHTEGPKVYWSKCPDGTTRITTLELYALSIERAPVVWCKPMTQELNLDLVDMLRDFYQSCGLNPLSNEVSNLLELPLPQHVKLEPKQLKRRHSFSAYQQKPSHRAKILQANEINFESVYYNLDDEMTSLLPLVSDYLPEEYQLLQEFNQRLRTKVAKYWAFMAAPESLKLYDLCTTGHDFENGETGIDPVYEEIPSRCGNFLKGHPLGWWDEKISHYPIPTHRSSATPPPPSHASPQKLASSSSPTQPSHRRVHPRKSRHIRRRVPPRLDVVRAARFLSGIAGIDLAQTPVTVSSAGAAVQQGSEAWKVLIHRTQYGEDEVLLRALKGEAGTVTPTFVKRLQEIEFFCSAVELGPNNVTKTHNLGNITAQEQELIYAALPELKKSIEKGFAFVQ